MPKRKIKLSGKRSYDTDDNPIGLTSAFAPVKGPQSVDYDNEDDPVGLTSAFGVVPDDPSSRTWNDENKWEGFNWSESYNDVLDGDEVGEMGAIKRNDKRAIDDGSDEGLQKQGIRKKNVHHETSVHEARKQERKEADQEDIENDDFNDDEFLDDEDLELEKQEVVEEQIESKVRKGKSKRGAHAAPEPELTPRMQKSRRTRRVLLVLVILFVVVVVALGYFAFRIITNSQQEAAQQTLDQTANATSADAIEQSSDAVDIMTRLADVPNLVVLLGMTQDEALAAIGHGALVTSNRETNEEGNPIKFTLNVALTDEAADSRTGTPTVYLGLTQEGRVCQAGYSASATSLGFSSLSFADAVNSEHVIEKTLAKAGVNVAEGSAVLPEDKASYTTYANDGTTIVRERCSFSGDVDVNGMPCSWSAVLSYDYTTQIVTGNLTDTVRIIYVYITQK